MLPPENEICAAAKSEARLRSPGLVRKKLDNFTILDRSMRQSRRAKSSEPIPLTPNNTLSECSKNEEEVPPTMKPSGDDKVVGKRWSILGKSQDNMSKSELINNYRLLMDEKLRLERFLSIISKHNEMARNRLESDLLDAMMCIEDLKQALEVRMARRRKIDPREAEERRYLIRQNKKLLNQLYDSAKKIEHLEVTKVEMKEQLELLDFQILEVENQKAVMEEELRKRIPTENNGTQTEITDFDQNLIGQLNAQIGQLQSELSTQRAEMAATLAKQHHLNNLVRELRQDNVDLRDQLAKIEDVEDFLAESDKPMAVTAKTLQTRLEEQTERVQELEAKLAASVDYASQLESRLQSVSSAMSDRDKGDITQFLPSKDDIPLNQDAMYRQHVGNLPKLLPQSDDRLLQEAIHTFHTLIAERDQELAHLLEQNKSQGPSTVGSVDPLQVATGIDVPIQTELELDEVDKWSEVNQTLDRGGILLSHDQLAALKMELDECQQSLGVSNDCLQSSENESFCFAQLLSLTTHIRQQAEVVSKLRTESLEKATEQEAKMVEAIDEKLNEEQTVEDLSAQIDRLMLELSRLQQKANTTNVSTGLPNGADATALNSDQTTSNHGSKTQTPQYYSMQLDELKRLNDLELAHSHLSISERRRQDLERRVTDLTDQLARAKAEARSADESLCAARRTEAAIRRRLLIAMDVQGTSADVSSNRYSLGANLGSSFEVKDTVELQAALLKTEATISSLTEAAQLDRTRLHEQAMRIAQFEAERRALLDRVSMLQATEANAQRGIVRLQALYEDMLREYSESRSQEFNWRNRERSRSKFRSVKDTSIGNGQPNAGMSCSR